MGVSTGPHACEDMQVGRNAAQQRGMAELTLGGGRGRVVERRAEVKCRDGAGVGAGGGGGGRRVGGFVAEALA